MYEILSLVQNMAIGNLRLHWANVTQAFKKVHPITGHQGLEVE